MADLIKLLEQFNRKERYFLIRQALVVEEFQLSERFRKKLGRKIGVPIHCDAFVAMDYHLNWVAGSIELYREPERKTFPKPDENAKRATQLDTDLLIAFEDDEAYHLVFIEAKGYDSWNNKQMNKKADILRSIFERDETKRTKAKPIKPHFCLVSQSRPTNLQTDGWPDWMWRKCKEDADRYYWLELCLPGCRREVTASCDCDNSAKGDHFHIKIQSATESP